MTPALVQRDERAVMVENASYRWAYLVISFGLLVEVIYRSYFRNESSWDLFALVILGGGVATTYQRAHKVFNAHSIRFAVIAMVVAAAVVGVLWLVARR
jgi:hypothetical protein